MPTPAYITVQGEKQGDITSGAFTADSVGNIWQEAQQDTMIVEAMDHPVLVPTDPQSGQPTGQRVHQPLKITTVYNKAVPLLYNALTSGERLTEVVIKWYRTSMDGTQEHYYTHKLEDAVIVNMTSYMYNCQDPAKASFTHLVDMEFSYRKITWTHDVAGTEGDDDWRAPDF
jgi:type VI secretion system secreted protein Hcp